MCASQPQSPKIQDPQDPPNDLACHNCFQSLAEFEDGEIQEHYDVEIQDHCNKINRKRKGKNLIVQGLEAPTRASPRLSKAGVTTKRISEKKSVRLASLKAADQQLQLFFVNDE